LSAVRDVARGDDRGRGGGSQRGTAGFELRTIAAHEPDAHAGFGQRSGDCLAGGSSGSRKGDGLEMETHHSSPRVPPPITLRRAGKASSVRRRSQRSETATEQNITKQTTRSAFHQIPIACLNRLLYTRTNLPNREDVPLSTAERTTVRDDLISTLRH